MGAAPHDPDIDTKYPSADRADCRNGASPSPRREDGICSADLSAICHSSSKMGSLFLRHPDILRSVSSMVKYVRRIRIGKPMPMAGLMEQRRSFIPDTSTWSVMLTNRIRGDR